MQPVKQETIAELRAKAAVLQAAGGPIKIGSGKQQVKAVAEPVMGKHAARVTLQEPRPAPVVQDVHPEESVGEARRKHRS